MSTLLFDIGGSNTRVALSNDGKRFGTPIVYPTPKDFEEGIKGLKKAAQQLSNGKKVTQIVGGILGTRDPSKSYLLGASHLPQWVKKPLRRRLEQAIHAPLLLENDSALVGLGEATYGAGRGKGIVAYVTVSTGVGGARIIDGHIDRSAFGFEPGHHILDRSSRVQCSCGLRGDLESLVSGTAVKKRFHKHPREVKDRRVWIELSRTFALGLINVATFWSPDIIVVGGSMLHQPGIIMPEVRRTFSTTKSPATKRATRLSVDIVPGTLGDIGGLYGALALARQLKRKR